MSTTTLPEPTVSPSSTLSTPARRAAGAITALTLSATGGAVLATSASAAVVPAPAATGPAPSPRPKLRWPVAASTPRSSGVISPRRTC